MSSIGWTVNLSGQNALFLPIILNSLLNAIFTP